MPQSHSAKCKQWLIDNGYADSMAQLMNVTITDDGKAYWSMFQWVDTHIHIDTHMHDTSRSGE